MTPRSAQNQNGHMGLEEALQTYPVVPAPPGLSRAVMKAVRTSVPNPQFRLSWFDYALTFFLTSMVGLILSLERLLPKGWIMLVRLQAFILWERSMRYSPALFWLLGCILILITISYAILLMKRPRLLIAPR
jgi:hypothetical protein